jgi:hypothetical protein
MAGGGWGSSQAIEPYLNAPSAEVVDDTPSLPELSQRTDMRTLSGIEM